MTGHSVTCSRCQEFNVGSTICDKVKFDMSFEESIIENSLPSSEAEVVPVTADRGSDRIDGSFNVTLF